MFPGLCLAHLDQSNHLKIISVLFPRTCLPRTFRLSQRFDDIFGLGKNHQDELIAFAVVFHLSVLFIQFTLVRDLFAFGLSIN